MSQPNGISRNQNNFQDRGDLQYQNGLNPAAATANGGVNGPSASSASAPPAEEQHELRVTTIAALSDRMKGDSRHGLYNGNGVAGGGGGLSGSGKRELYEGGHVAQCSKTQAVAITVFVLTGIFLTSLAIAFIRPFHAQCAAEDEGEVVVPKEELELVATNGEDFPWDDIRLPKFIQPIRYDIELTPNLTTGVVKGVQKLIFTVKEETKFVVFHAKDLNITSRTMNERLNVEKMLEFPPREQIYLETDEPMVPGVSYAIRLKFQYELSKHLEGFYVSTYKDIEGKERKLATSHFEPTYARRAFPCFDEPELKARFLMTIVHDKEYVAFFNTPRKAVADVRGEPNQIRDEFEETVKMSTYLVAFVVCDFVQDSVMSQKGINVSVLASTDKIDQAQFALKSAAKIMDYYDDFFGVPYPLKKEDLIAIPDFGAGAMENWGLITYRETALLYSEGDTSADGKQWVAIVVAHELAHQWFGNLVTMKWWNDLWLNEGFASWMEYRGVDHIEPSWRMMDQFFHDMIMPALELDSLTTSHPISVDVRDPKEIEAIFDAISYKKGASVIHMLEDTVGEDVIRAGLSRYLKKHEFSNAVTDDLWTSISHEWDKDKESWHNFTVKEMMDTWTLQMGYPLVTFEKVKGASGKRYVIKQQRFYKAMNLNDTELSSEKDGSYSWLLPVSFKTNLADFPAQTLVLNKSHSLDVEFPGDAAWFKANLNGTGFYRVNYPLDNWDAIIEALQRDHTQFSPADRAQLINDAFSLSEANLLPATKPLSMCLYLVKENEIVPWAAALRHFNNWKTILQGTDAVPLINNLIRHLISPIYNKLGWEDQGDHMEKLLRKQILLQATMSEIPEAKEQALKLFKALKEEETPVSPNLRWIAYAAGVKFGDKSDWGFAWSQFTHARVPSEKSLWMRALATARDPYILQRYLGASLERDMIRPQDVTSVLSGVAHNHAGSQLAWRHLRMNWDFLVSQFGAGSFIMGSLIDATTSHFSSEFDYQEVKEFFKARRNEVGSGKRSLDQSMEQIRINVAWRKNHEKDAKEWIKKKLDASDDKDLFTWTRPRKE